MVVPTISPVASPVSAGTIVKIAFATRVSGTGHKYWRLEYRDGDQWKIAGRSFVDEAVDGPDGKPVVYTHAMNPDGATNTLVETAVTYENATDQVEFRFICAANYRANGAGPLAAPNVGTWRLSVDTKDGNDPYQPSISIVAAGGEPPVMANVSLSASYLYMEGSGTARQFLPQRYRGDCRGGRRRHRRIQTGTARPRP